ncbi:MAG TPA: hypothetical protein ENF87_02465, partial [Thermoproteales archaeon]|nr:hypothetical protein [Thermoproteales archaeon]
MVLYLLLLYHIPAAKSVEMKLVLESEPQYAPHEWYIEESKDICIVREIFAFSDRRSWLSFKRNSLPKVVRSREIFSIEVFDVVLLEKDLRRKWLRKLGLKDYVKVLKMSKH